jgi:hypothetical protein
MGDIRLATLRETGVNTALVLHPEWAVTGERRLDASHHRSLAGRLYSYRWGAYSTWRVPLRFVDAAVRDLLDAWWRDRETLLFTLDTSAQPSGVVCRIVNPHEPLGRPVPDAPAPGPAQWPALWAGLLALEAVDGRQRLGLPFVLDDPVFGRLDQADLFLL